MNRRHLILTATLIALTTLTGARQMVQAPRFEVDPLWPRPLPNHWLLGSAVGVAVDARDHVFVVNLTNSFNARTEIGAASTPPTGECCLPAPAVLEFDPTGKLVRSWGGPGEGYVWPVAATGIAIDPKGNLWLGGSGGTDTQLLKFSPTGKFLLQSGSAVASTAVGDTPTDTTYRGVSGAPRTAGRPAAPMLAPNSSSLERFGGAAGITFDAAANEGFVADGYRNRRVAVIDLRTGRIKRYFGAGGAQPQDRPTTSKAQFGNPVSCAELARDGLLYVCDRAHNRIQVFRTDGTFVKEQVIAGKTGGAGSVWDIAFSRDPQQRYLYVADGLNMKVHILDRASLRTLTSFGDGGRQPGQFFAVHSIATDSKGNLYTTEALEGKRVQKFVYKGVGPVTKPNNGTVWPRAGRQP